VSTHDPAHHHSVEDGADLEALTDLSTPWCIRVVVTLRIAEHVESGVCEIGALADVAGCDRFALHAVLAYLVSKGVFVEEPSGVFALNDAARGLLDTSRFLGLDGIGGRMAQAWAGLLTYVRTGQPGYQEIFGLPFWDDIAAHPAIGADFDELMGAPGHGVPDASIDLVDGWDGVRTVVDVGGGTGAMLAELLRARPGVRGVLVDLPGTVARAGDVFDAAGVADRVTVVGQSFFEPLPAGGDVYLLRKVLNDWPDRETVAILARCASAAGVSGRVVALAGVVPDGTPRPLSIEMVLLAGRTNTVSEFRELAREAGLEVVAAGQQGSYFRVELRVRAGS
jgi:hypothetical protein